MTIRTEIKSAFAASGMSMKQLSDTSGVPYSCVHGFLKSDTAATVDVVEKLMRALGLEVKPVKK